MNSNEENPISETTAAEQEQVRTEQREASKSANVLNFQSSEEDEEKNKSELTDKKTAPEENSSVNIAESSNTVDKKMESKAVSSADSIYSTVVAKENELLCQDSNTAASSESLTPDFRPENACEGAEEKQASKSVITSEPSTTSAGAAKKAVVESMLCLVSKTVGLSSLTAVAAGKDEKDVEPVADSASGASGVEIKQADTLSVISSQKAVLSGYSTEIADSISSVSEGLSVETRACEKIISEVYRFGSSSESEINSNNNLQETIPVTAASDVPVIGAHSDNATQCEIKETENKRTAMLNTREPEDEEFYEDNEGRASFYISSCSVPGMGEGSEWPSVSDNYRMPVVTPGRHVAPQQNREPRRCLGTKRCHYVITAIAFLTTFLGCIAYHLSNSGKIPAVLKPIGASTAFISFAVCVLSAVYINYLKDSQRLPIVPNYELLGDVDSVMAMNRVSNPEIYDAEDGTYALRNRTAAAEYCIRETQSADVLDRRGYGRHSTESPQTDSKRCSDESGTLYSTQRPKKFKAMLSSSGQDVEEINGGEASSSPHEVEEIPLDTQGSDEYHNSETTPLLPKRQD